MNFYSVFDLLRSWDDCISMFAQSLKCKFWFSIEPFDLTNAVAFHLCMCKMQSSPVLQKQNAQLLDLLLRRPQTALRRFLFALVETDQEHLAELLDSSLTAQYVRERDARRNPDDEPEALGSQASSRDPGGALVPSEQSTSKVLG